MKLQSLTRRAQKDIIALAEAKAMMDEMGNHDYSLFPEACRMAAQESLKEKDLVDSFDYRMACTRVFATAWQRQGFKDRQLVLSFSVDSTDKEADRQHVVFYWVENDRTLTFIKDYLNI